VTEVRKNNLHDIDPRHFSVVSKKTRYLPVFARDVGWAILPAAGLPAGWTRWKAGPQAEKPAPLFRRIQVLFLCGRRLGRASSLSNWCNVTNCPLRICSRPRRIAVNFGICASEDWGTLLHLLDHCRRKGNGHGLARSHICGVTTVCVGPCPTAPFRSRLVHTFTRLSFLTGISGARSGRLRGGVRLLRWQGGGRSR
jgi:hypothetical protein